MPAAVSRSAGPDASASVSQPPSAARRPCTRTRRSPRARRSRARTSPRSATLGGSPCGETSGDAAVGVGLEAQEALAQRNRADLRRPPVAVGEYRRAERLEQRALRQPGAREHEIAGGCLERRVAPRGERRVAGLPDDRAVAAVPRHRRHVARAEIPEVAQAAVAGGVAGRRLGIAQVGGVVLDDRPARVDLRPAWRTATCRCPCARRSPPPRRRGSRRGGPARAWRPSTDMPPDVVVARRARRCRWRTASASPRGAIRPCDDQMRSCGDARPRPATARARRSAGARGGGGTPPTRHPRVLPERPRAFALAGKMRGGSTSCHDRHCLPARRLTCASVSGCGAPVARKIGHAGLGLARVRTRAREPFAELAKRAGVVVVPLLLLEERIEVGVGIEAHADEQVRVLARELPRAMRPAAAGCASCSGGPSPRTR